MPCYPEIVKRLNIGKNGRCNKVFRLGGRIGLSGVLFPYAGFLVRRDVAAIEYAQAWDFKIDIRSAEIAGHVRLAKEKTRRVAVVAASHDDQMFYRGRFAISACARGSSASTAPAAAKAAMAMVAETRAEASPPLALSLLS